MRLIEVEEACELFAAFIPEEKKKGLSPTFSSLSAWRSKAIGGIIKEACECFLKDYGGIMGGGEMLPLLDEKRIGGNQIAVCGLKEKAHQYIFKSEEIINHQLAGRKAIHGLLDEFFGTLCQFEKVGWDIDSLKSTSQRVLFLTDRVLMSGTRSGLLRTRPNGNEHGWREVIHRLLDFIAGLSDPQILRVYRTMQGYSA